METMWKDRLKLQLSNTLIKKIISILLFIPKHKLLCGQPSYIIYQDTSFYQQNNEYVSNNNPTNTLLNLYDQYSTIKRYRLEINYCTFKNNF